MRIIDFHTHYFPDKIVERAMSSLSNTSGLKPFSDGTLAGLVSTMKIAGIEFALNLPLATNAESTMGLNAWAAKSNNAPVFTLGSIHPDCQDADNIADFVKRSGLRGIKMHPEYQRFNVLEKRLEKIWESCINHELFVVIHAGADIAFKPPFMSCPEDFAELYLRYPKLNMVIAHCGSWGMWEAAEKSLAGRVPFYLDLSFTPGMLDDDSLMRMIKTHGADRIIFGTDSPWREQKEEVRKVNALPLSGKEKSLIFFENAAKLLDIR
ncbi:MAG: hypothetical protein A2020_02850 [Lentisphaerae bacterium GWF2_45_14]|nr:MAG: hypothetical protein A2020_02850 [Lentisphaerae bacterium GWF2_45_14]